MQFHAKGHWSQPQSANAGTYRVNFATEKPEGTRYQTIQSAIAWTYRGTFYRSISSDQDPANNNQQLLGLIKEFTKEPSETKRPRTIAPSEPPATSHGHNQPPLPCNSKRLDLQNGTFFKYLAHVNMFYFAFYF